MKSETCRQGKHSRLITFFDRLTIHFLWFAIGNLVGYLWAVRAYRLF